MTDFGFEDYEEIKEPEVVEDNYEVEIPEEPKTKIGDIYKLGDHIVMCGDSTELKDVEKLCGGGTELDLFFTDPPYNVDIGGLIDSEPNGIRTNNKRVSDGIENDNMEESKFYNFLLKTFNNAKQVLKEGGAFYIFHASRFQKTFENTLEENDLQVKEQLIWVKNTFVIGRQDYQWQHEPCFYGWKSGASHYFIDKRNIPTIIEDKLDFEKMKKEDMKKILEEIYSEKLPTTIVRENKPVRSDLHPTMKPIKLCARLIQNSTKPGESVLDLFGGSGSTLIACEQLGRKCYMMEYDPHYVDVIINRWEDFTGQKAVKL